MSTSVHTKWFTNYMSTLSGKGHRRRKDVFEHENEDDNIVASDKGEASLLEVNPKASDPPALMPLIDIENERLKSRAAYLQKRFENKIKDLREDVERLESQRNLSAREAQEYKEKKDLLQSIEDTKTPNDVHQYDIPGLDDPALEHDRSKKRDLLTSKDTYDDPDTFETKKKFRFENQWELHQLRKANEIRFAHPDEIQIQLDRIYEYVFDDSQFIDFAEEGETQSDPSEDYIEPTITSSRTSIKEVRESLPVFSLRSEFLQKVEENQVLIVVGETGSGKTTQLPQYLYEAGYTNSRSEKNQIQKVGCTQPRRVAATSVATRVADEVGCKLGEEVGYSIRFEDVTSEKTHIKYLTDGMLLREFLTDPLLSTYKALMIDEAHERTVSTEIVLGLLKDIVRERKDLKLIVASATINAAKFSEYFDGAPVFNIPGRRFPVEICYTKNPEANYIQAAITTIFQIHTTQNVSGDILVFLTGQDEIESMHETLIEACDKIGSSINKLIVAPIYANLPPKEQQKIFEPTPPGARKVVLATNIAETSITIDGIRFVIDPGYVKENVYNPTTGMESLVVMPCSRASADQRAGRAGRVGPGKCYRLFTKWSFYNELQASPTPEIQRTNLSTVVLLLLSMGITDLMHFDFMDPPSSQILIKSLELLYSLGALNAKGQITKLGRKMAEFPMDPMFCKCLLKSADFGVTGDILSIMALLSESSSLFFRPKDKREQADKKKETFHHEFGDHLTLLNIWNQWEDTGFSNIWAEENFLQYRTLKRAKEVRSQLEGLCKRVEIDIAQQKEKFQKISNEDQLRGIQKSLVAGFFPNVAKLSKLGTNYTQLKRKMPVFIHPSSTLYHMKPPPKLVMYHELVLTSKEYMRNCMIIEEKWLDELAMHYYITTEPDHKNRNS